MSKLFHLKDCSSTNDEITQFLLYPETDFLGIYTFNQTKGRGQYGNQWITQPNENLAFSFALKTKNISTSDYLFNYYTAIIVRDFINSETGVLTQIKWPNDLIVNKKKIGGILIEKKKVNGEMYFIIGIGINILQQKFENISNAGSLYTQTGQNLDFNSFAENLFTHLSKSYNTLPKDQEILNQLNTNLFRKDTISVFEVGETRKNGIIRYADEYGKLTIEFEDQIKQFYLKEVKLLY